MCASDEFCRGTKYQVNILHSFSLSLSLSLFASLARPLVSVRHSLAALSSPLSALRPLQSYVGPWYTDLQWKAGSFCAAVREPQHTELVGSQIDGKDGIRRFPRPSVDLISEYAAWETVGYATLHV